MRRQWKPTDLGLSYEAAAHGVQTAIAFEMEVGDSHASEPKHMQVGVDMKADIGGLAMLRIAKGLFMADEYAEALRLAANTELAMREAVHRGIRFR
jgi:hypothetical protein